MLCKLNSGCVLPTTHGCEFQAVQIDTECNEMMLETSKVMAFVGKFAVAATFSIMYTFSAELYPTCVRSSAVGFCSSCARVGGALSPLIFGFDHERPWFSNTVFGLLSFIGKFSNPPNGSTGRHESCKNHSLSACQYQLRPIWDY